MHAIRGSSPHAIGIRRDSTRADYHQSGPSSRDILCHRCEASTQRADDHAFRFARRFDSVAVKDRFVWQVENRRPRDLQNFVHTTVWRSAAAGMLESDLITPRILDEIRGVAFEGKKPFPVFIMRPGRTINGGEARVILPPEEWRSEDSAFIAFEAGCLRFNLKIDGKPVGPDLALLMADRDPLLVLDLAQGEMTRDPAILALASAYLNRDTPTR